MERFLSECARYINFKYGADLIDLCIVFPNHRSGSFFMSYLQKQIRKPVIAPEITTINDFIIKISSFNLADRLFQVSLLYELYTDLSGSVESLDDFYLWGEMLLSDFNDIDKNLIEARDLFTNVAEIKEIDSVFDYLSDSQKEVIRQFWDTLGRWEDFKHQAFFVNAFKLLFPLYSKFSNDLTNQGIASEGMAYRAAVKRLLNGNALPDNHEKYIFIGLNALNACEKAILRYLKQNEKAEFLWDFDLYYLTDMDNGAGRFIRQNLIDFPPPDDFSFNNQNFRSAKNFQIVAVSSLHSQSQIIPHAISSFAGSFKPEHDNTAIILADESLLFSALGAIPDEITSVNVTMGYSFKNSILFGFVTLLSSLLKNSAISESGHYSFYYRNVVDLLSHQLLSGIEPEKTVQIITEIKAKNRLMINSEELSLSDIHDLIFVVPGSITEYPNYFLTIFHAFFRQITFNQPENRILAELIFETCNALEKLREAIFNLNKKTVQAISPGIFFRILSQYLGLINIPFEGEPLAGLQVMGILETRCLDFENLIILGLNEGQWPKQTVGGSYIPYNVRKGFGMPGIDDQEAMSAYYFYRLIQRATNIVITYNTSRDGAGAGELSRYGEQIRYLSPSVPVMKNVIPKFSGRTPGSISIPMTSDIRNRILNSINPVNPLSPSQIITYLTCRLKYYFRYIVGLPEQEEVSEEIDARLFGIIFHNTIENIYRPMLNNTISKEVLAEIRNNKQLVNNEILRSICKNYFKESDKTSTIPELKGKAYLVAENLRTFIGRVLEIDENVAPFKITGLEKKMIAAIEIPGVTKKISIGGIIDRLDEKDGKIRIIDYKTGKLESQNFDDIHDLFSPEGIDKIKEILQAVTYSWIMAQSGVADNAVRPCIYSLRNLFSDQFNPEITFRKSEFQFSEIREDFLPGLRKVVSDMFNPEILYSQTVNAEACKYCPFNLICNKY